MGLAVPPDRFDLQMNFLARNKYRCLTLAEAVSCFRQGGRLPSKAFVLTFDDGYQDVYAAARPILGKYGFTASVFLVAGRLGAPSNWWGQMGERSGLLMSLAEARDLARQGYILGSHTLSHPFLNRLDDQSAFDEIRNSKLLLQNQLDMQIDYFSYPFSETDARVEKLVESAGYAAACDGNSGHWGIFHLWRVPCLRDDIGWSFSMKVNGLYNTRTALRESTLGQLSRGGVHLLRRWLGLRHPRRAAVLDPALEGDPQETP